MQDQFLTFPNRVVLNPEDLRPVSVDSTTELGNVIVCTTIPKVGMDSGHVGWEIIL